MGGGTTAAVAHKMGRQYTGVEQLDYGKNDSIVRLNNVVKGDASGISKSVDWKGGGDFLYCELMKYNETYMEKIQAAKTSKELVALWKDISEDSFLNWYVNPELPEEAVNDFIAIGEDGQTERKNINKQNQSATGSPQQKHDKTGETRQRLSRSFPKAFEGNRSGLETQKRLLVELLNKNQLYVNLSEVDDRDFKVSQEDKQLNNLFFEKD